MVINKNLIYIVLFLGFTLPFTSCIPPDEYGCPQHTWDCHRDYKISFTYSFTPAQDTYQVGEPIDWELEIPYSVWDTCTSKYISMRELELFPIVTFYEVDFEEKTYQIPSYSVVHIDSVLKLDGIDTSNFQGTAIGNRLYMNLKEEEERRVGKFAIHFETPGSYIVKARVDPESNDDYLNNKFRFDTLDDVCCLQSIDPFFKYVGEVGGYHKWFQQDSIFDVIDFDGKHYERNMLDPWTAKDKQLIFHVVE